MKLCKDPYMAGVGSDEPPVFATLNELYDFCFSYVEELKARGLTQFADQIDHALRGGATSGEILAYLGVAFRDIRLAGKGDADVRSATITINRFLGLSDDFSGE